jgi:hypothetical protein
MEEYGDCLKVCSSPFLLDADRQFSAENRNLTDKDEIEKALRMGEYIKKGVQTLVLTSVFP